MKSFLLKGKQPIIKWGMLPDNYFFEGQVPSGYSLAVCPSEGYIIIDVDRHGSIDGFNNIPVKLKGELSNTFNYKTKNDGMHFWFKYSGDAELANKASGLGIDLRTHKGYVVYYPKKDIRKQLKKIKSTSKELNRWIEELFGYVKSRK